MKYIYVIAGGAAGSVLRLVVVDLIVARSTTGFPLGTFAVNMLGSLVIGLLFGLFAVNGVLDDKIKFLVFVGFLGGFTTFSSFALENMKLLQSGVWSTALLYILLSNILGVGLAMAGYQLGTKFT